MDLFETIQSNQNPYDSESNQGLVQGFFYYGGISQRRGGATATHLKTYLPPKFNFSSVLGHLYLVKKRIHLFVKK